MSARVGFRLSCTAFVAAALMCAAVPIASAAPGADDVGTVQVTVTDAQTHVPLAGACAATQNGPSFIFGCTDSTGQATLTDAVPGTYSLSISAPTGYVGGLVQNVVVVAGQTTPVATTLNEAAVALITIRDRATGAPVSNACADFVSPDLDTFASPEPVFCSDQNGQITFASDPIQFQLFIVPFDGVHGMQWVGAHGGTGDMREARSVRTRTGRTTRVQVWLDGAGTISVSAVDAVSGAGVDQACPWVTPQPSADVVPCSGPDGQFLLSGLGPYRWNVEVADYSGVHAWTWSGDAADRFASSPVRVRVGQSSSVTVRLPLAGRITGSVTDTGVSPQFVGIIAHNSRTGDTAAPEANPDADFHYVLSGLATQNVSITYGVAGSSGDLEFPHPVHVTAGRTHSGVDLVIPAGS
jgi:hypothetical protein